MTVIHVGLDNYEKEVKDTKTPVIVDFWAPWCGPCQMMSPMFESLSNKYKGKLKFVKINTDEEPNIAQKFQIQGVPCLVIIKGSKEIDRIVGYAPESSLKQRIDNILEKFN